MQQLIRLAKVTINNSVQIANTLSNDKLLAKANGSSDLAPVTPQEFFDKTKQWQIATNSEPYIICLGNSSIGMISLSHIDSTSARAGCWIASNEWHKGYGTQAFNLLLEIAKKRGIKTIISTINLNSIASLRIWEKAGAIIDKSGKKAKATLLLN